MLIDCLTIIGRIHRQITVAVTPRNLYAPTFYQVAYTVYVYRNSAADTHVLAMHATDRDEDKYNRNFSFYVTGGRYSSYFRITSSTGDLRLKKRLENPPETFDLAVTVRDTGTRK